MCNLLISITGRFKIIGLSILFSSIFLTCLAQFGGGDGTEANPWRISRPEHLDQIRNHMQDFFIQTDNIDMDIAPWNQDTGWQPIGESMQVRFEGVYNGDGHVISGLFIDRANQSNIGFFGHTGDGAIIKNLGLVDVDIRGNQYVGAVVGWNRDAAKVINCYSTGRVRGNSHVGGLVGYNQNRNSIIVDSYSRANMEGGVQVGGIVGHNRNAAAVTGSYSTGRVTGQEEVGGLAGFSQAWGDDPPDNNYWDIETSGQQNSEIGTGRLTRQMTYPYDQDTYIGWDFEDLWFHDEDERMNDGYPFFYFQEPAWEPLDAPEIVIEKVTIDNVLSVRISWEEIENANSYFIFTSNDPQAEDWGEPIARTAETFFVRAISEYLKEFFYVTASYQEP